mgnify:FL=1
MPAINYIKLTSDIGGEIKLEHNTLRRTVLVIRSVGHKLRQQIIKMLEETPRLTVTEIYIKLRIEQSIASQHLSILRRSGVVISKRTGKFIYYSLNKERLVEIGNLIKELVK